MPISKKIAGLLGPVLVVLGISESINPKLWVGVSATQIYLAGILWFVAGLSIIRAHNIWKGWPAVITIMGWFSILLGLARIFFTNTSGSVAQNNLLALTLQLVLIAIGAFLTVKAYAKRE